VGDGPRGALLRRLGVPAEGKLKKALALDRIWASLHSAAPAATEGGEWIALAAESVVEINTAWLDAAASANPSFASAGVGARRALPWASSAASAATAEAEAQAAASLLLGLVLPAGLGGDNGLGARWAAALLKEQAHRAALDVVKATLAALGQKAKVKAK